MTRKDYQALAATLANLLRVGNITQEGVEHITLTLITQFDNFNSDRFLANVYSETV
jgi:hypothetical protein